MILVYDRIRRQSYSIVCNSAFHKLKEPRNYEIFVGILIKVRKKLGVFTKVRIEIV